MQRYPANATIPLAELNLSEGMYVEYRKFDILDLVMYTVPPPW
jgi:hypothetical protein